MVLASWGQGAGNLLGYSCLGTFPEGPVGIGFITLNWTELLFSRLLFFLALCGNLVQIMFFKRLQRVSVS